MKRIGILGGMGPLATIDLYDKIVELTNAAKEKHSSTTAWLQAENGREAMHRNGVRTLAEKTERRNLNR